MSEGFDDFCVTVCVRVRFIALQKIPSVLKFRRKILYCKIFSDYGNIKIMLLKISISYGTLEIARPGPFEIDRICILFMIKMLTSAGRWL